MKVAFLFVNMHKRNVAVSPKKIYIVHLRDGDEVDILDYNGNTKSYVITDSNSGPYHFGITEEGDAFLVRGY